MAKKTLLRIFTIADYEEEELWLREQHRNGWKLERTVTPCFYFFESCTPEDVVYRLDYKNNAEDGDYMQLLRDYGWEYFNRCMGWLYFRKSASETDAEQDQELFSDNASRVEMISHIVRTRMLPLLLIFFTSLLPNFFRGIEPGSVFPRGLTVLYCVLFVLYLYLFLHCGLKLRRLRQKYSDLESDL